MNGNKRVTRIASRRNLVQMRRTKAMMMIKKANDGRTDTERVMLVPTPVDRSQIPGIEEVTLLVYFKLMSQDG